MIQQSELTVAETSQPSPSVGYSKQARRISILLVDDDDLYRDALQTHLADEGLEVASFSSGRAGLDHLDAGNVVDAILLDWRMPEMNGLEVLRQLRERGVTTPVIFLTALSDDTHEEAALTGGAVDFIDKSRRISILVKRIELIVEAQRLPPESGESQAAQIRLGELELRFDSHRAFWRGQVVALTLTEFCMVSRLAMKPGEDVSYRELYDLVHGKDFVAGYGTDGYRTNVRTFIKRIRKKFRGIDDGFTGIENYASFGYRWRLA
ncbi:MAG TPA: response regulator transcription factor [Stellaceae bacterium]|nr:response regulator transcription factor [Stellaceae bacterium]